MSSHPAGERFDSSESIKDVLKGLHTDIAALRGIPCPDFINLRDICERLKNAENLMQQAQVEGAAGELNLLLAQLPTLLKKIDLCLETQFFGTRLEISHLETLCMGLSTIASPFSGCLLDVKQSNACQPILSTLSNRLARILTGHTEHGTAEPGPLLNCLNWFSRGLKAGLIQKNQSAVHAVFKAALDQMLSWSASATSFNGRQFAKCMVQLNIMIKQPLLNIDAANASGQVNRATWAVTVENLCRHFLSDNQWLHDCNLIELINLTNTLKDGFEKGLLSPGAKGLAQVPAVIADRIALQGFDLRDPSSLAGLGNCANFLRCLFEHNLLGTTNSATGQAMLHLVNALHQPGLHETVTSSSAQALVNLASFIKATDRWLVAQKQTGAGSHATLGQASHTLLKALSTLSEGQDSHWIRSTQTSSGLLAALPYLWQRGLVRAQQRGWLESILIQVLQNIPDWKQAERKNLSLLLSLRALVAIVDKESPVAYLSGTPAFANALTTLIIQLQQSKLVQYSDEERLVSLQAVRLGAALGCIALNAFQPLLQGLLKTKDQVDLQLLEAAITNFGGVSERVEPLSEEALSQSAARDSAPIPLEKKSKPRGDTYRGSVPTQQVKPERLPAQPASGQQHWIVIDKGIKSPLLLEEPPLSLPFTATPSTAPKLVERSPEQKTTELNKNNNKGNKQKEKTMEARQTALMTSLPPVRIEKAQRTQIRPTNEARTLKEAQARWFNLLEELSSASPEELKKLAEAYPQLINMKAPGKQGQVALFYALTQGKKEIVEWLMNHEQDVLKDKPDAQINQMGEFLIAALNTIGNVERRHVSGVRVLIELYLKKYEERTQATHAQNTPGGQRLSKQEIIAKKSALLSTEQKTALKQFSALTSLLNENKLLSEAAGTTEAQNKVITTAELKLMQEMLLSAALTGDLSKVKDILNVQAKLSQKEVHHILIRQHESSITALMLAAQAQHTEVIKLLLDSVQDQDAMLQVKNNNGLTALMYATDSDNHKVVDQLLRSAKNKDALLQMTNNDGWTALMLAIYKGHTKTAMALINAANNKDALMKIKNNVGWTALMFAASDGHKIILNRLLNAADNKDALAQTINKNGNTALIIAAEKGYAEIIEILLNVISDKDAAVQMKNNDTLTGLMLAAHQGHIKTAAMLLNAVNDKDTLAKIKNKTGANALLMAAKNGHVEMANTILNAVNDKDSLAQEKMKYGTTALMVAANSGDKALLNQLLSAVKDKSALVQQKNDQGFTALMIAAYACHSAIETAILSKVNDKNALAQMRTEDGMAALMFSAAKNYMEIVAQLMSVLSDKDVAHIKIRDEMAAIKKSASDGHIQIIAKLLSALKNKEELAQVTDKGDATGLMAAAAKSYKKIMSQLINYVEHNDALTQAKNKDD